MSPYLLLGIGLLLIFLEFYLPGAVMGIVGTVLVILSVVVFATQAGSPIELLLFVIGVVIAIWALVYLTLKRIRRSGRENTIYLEKDQQGYVASAFDESTIGKRGVATSDLKPAGHALIDGQPYQVISQTGYIVEGTEIEVIGGQGASLFVREAEKN